MKFLHLYFLLIFGIVLVFGATFKAGVSKVDLEVPLGVPLAGFNHGERRVPFWPIPDPQKYSTFMTGNIGVLDPLYAKALVLDNGSTKICFVTIDAIGSDGAVSSLAYDIAVNMGFKIPRENVIFSGSHSHSGPGAITPEFLWEFAPATDLVVPEIQTHVCTKVANAMLQAQNSMVNATFDLGVGYLVGVTENRRGPNPWLRKDSIDPNLGVLRVDDASTGHPIATLWNFAMHGTCYGPSNMRYSADVMGAVNAQIESLIGGISLFANADAGDIDPSSATCGPCSVQNQQPVCQFSGAPIIAKAVKQVRDGLKPTNDVQIKVASQIIPFGLTDLNITLQRFSNCSSGGPLDICTLCAVLKCDANLHLDSGWVEENPRFSAFKFVIRGKSTIMVTLPGEPLLELGWWVRNDTKNLGFDQTFLLGYSQNHMGYFATPNEYDWGGYESQLTFWGIDTAEKIRRGCYAVATLVQ